MQDTTFKAAFYDGVRGDAASALAEAGRTQDLFDAGLQGSTVRPAGPLGEMIERRASLGDASPWREFEAFILGCIQLGLARPAVSAWRQELSLAGGPLSGALDAIVPAAPAILRMSPAAVANDILLELSAVLPNEDDRQALAAMAHTLRPSAPAADGARPLLTERSSPFARFIAGEACAAADQWGMAIDQFKGLQGAGALRHLGSELARCVGRDVLKAHPLLFGPPRATKVFDVFPFNGEFDMLAFKLAEMGPWVDHFVLVETARTFTGMPKPLHFEARRDEYRDYGDKIIHVVVESLPDHMSWAWAREFYQRDSAIRGLSGRLTPDDLVLLSDADEIVDRRAMDRFSGEVRGLAMRTFQYFFNYEIEPARRRIKTVVARGRALAANGSSYLRVGALQYGRADRIADGGWHFTSVKKPEDLALKMKSYSHEEHAHLDADYFSRTLQDLRDGRGSALHVRQEIDESFPAHLRRNRESLARFIL